MLLLAREAVASVAFVQSPTHSFRSMKPFPAQQIASSQSPERQNRSKRLSTCSSKGKTSSFYHFIFLHFPAPSSASDSCSTLIHIEHNTISSFHHSHHYVMIIMCSTSFPLLRFIPLSSVVLLCNSIAFVDSSIHVASISLLICVDEENSVDFCSGFLRTA